MKKLLLLPLLLLLAIPVMAAGGACPGGANYVNSASPLTPVTLASLGVTGCYFVAANGNDGNLVEINPESRKQVAVKLVDSTPPPPLGAGSLFGLFVTADGVYFVDDISNTFNQLH